MYGTGMVVNLWLKRKNVSTYGNHTIRKEYITSTIKYCIFYRYILPIDTTVFILLLKSIKSLIYGRTLVEKNTNYTVRFLPTLPALEIKKSTNNIINAAGHKIITTIHNITENITSKNITIRNRTKENTTNIKSTSN